MDDDTEENPATVMRAYLDSRAPTPPLADFMIAYSDDDNWWWRLSCGHHQNLFDAAIEAAAGISHRVLLAAQQHGPADYQENMCVTCLVTMPCPTLIALEESL